MPPLAILSLILFVIFLIVIVICMIWYWRSDRTSVEFWLWVVIVVSFFLCLFFFWLYHYARKDIITPGHLINRSDGWKDRYSHRHIRSESRVYTEDTTERPVFDPISSLFEKERYEWNNDGIL